MWIRDVSTFDGASTAIDKSDPCEPDNGELFYSDDGKLATAHSQTLQFPPLFNEASYEDKTFFFLAVYLLKVKNSNLPTVRL